VSFGATQEAKEQVRQSTDIVELVGASIPLRRQGRIYVGLCPWHDDSRPSLQVNPDRQTWKCWVCNIGGDVFNWCMQREGVEFREALEMLADRAGVTLPSFKRAPPRPGSPSDKRTLYDVMAWAQRQYRDCLMRAPEAEPARRYLEERGINREMRAAFHLGFVPPGWQWLLDRAKSTSYSPAVLEAAGLAGKKEGTDRYYDFFRGRVMFPIRDTQSRPIGFGGRILPGQTDPGKYINSRDTRLFSKSDQLYGLDLARDAVVEKRKAVVVEGYTDVIMAHQYGLKNVVAVLGTALGPRHIRLLKRYAESITLVLDGDEAGQRRANEVLELFIAADADLKILTLPQGLDPCDYLQQHGADEMQRRLEAAPDALEHAIWVQTQGIDLVRDTHRANQALEVLLAILAKAPRSSASEKLVRQQMFLTRLAREFRIEEAMLRRRIEELRRVTPATRVTMDATSPPAGYQVADLDPHDRELLEILVAHPSLTDVALEELENDHFVSAPARELFWVYRQLGDLGSELEFAHVLTALEDPRLKNLLVDLDQRSRVKEEDAIDDAAERLSRLIKDILYRHREAKRRGEMNALEDSELDDEEKKKLFLKLLEEQRKRQGIPAPTDG
jgi:DNA primase